jgi:hypothetical protein
LDAKAPTLPDLAAALPARPSAGARWLATITTIDWIAIVLALIVSVATLADASVPVVPLWRAFTVDLVWPFVAMAWAYSVYHYLEDDDAVRAGRLLLVCTFATVLAIIPHLILEYTGVLGAALAIGGAGVLLGLVIVHERPARLAWLVVPTIASATVGLLMADAPAKVRLGMNEATLTAYAESVARDESPRLAYGDPPVEVGSFEFIRIDTLGGCVRFATAYVVVDQNPGSSGSADELAGLVYCPSGPPAEGGRRPARYEPMVGAWYRWLPLPRTPA